MKEQQKSELEKLRYGIKELREEYKIIKVMKSKLGWTQEEGNTIADVLREIEYGKEENFQDKK